MVYTGLVLHTCELALVLGQRFLRGDLEELEHKDDGSEVFVACVDRQVTEHFQPTNCRDKFFDTRQTAHVSGAASMEGRSRAMVSL